MGAEVAAYLRDLIMSGHLKPGEHLRLTDLASQLSISTTPVREALLILEKEGVIDSEPRRGFRVKPLTADDIRDLFELHAVMAGIAANRAAFKLSDAEVAELQAIDRQLKKAVADGVGEEIQEIDFRFHRYLNRAADSLTLRRFLTETTRYIPRRYYAQIPLWLSRANQDHSSIMDALSRKDGAAIQNAMEAHIRRAGTTLVDHLDSMGVWSSAAEPMATNAP
jgi:DNA-binding GntR family transcriptional regulator